MRELIDTVPELHLAPPNSDNLLPELQAYQFIYYPLFQRREQRQHAQKYLHGLLLDDVSNKSIESMMLALDGDNPNAIRAMQQFLGRGAWSDGLILQQHWQEVDQDLGDENGVIILDGTDFAKQGQDSVGVKRQWCDGLGKRTNCQTGIFLAYASPIGFTLLDRRLFLPVEWVNDEAYAERRCKCGIPKEIEFKTKTELGQEMIEAVQAAGSLRYRWLRCAEGFGKNPAFLDRVAELVYYYAAVPHDTRVWPQGPATGVPEWSERDPRRVRTGLQPDEPNGQTVKAIAAVLPTEQWSRHTIKEGDNGSITANFAAFRVVAERDGLPGPEVWLVLRRELSSGELKCYLSNAPAETTLTTLVWLSGMRWPTETCFKQGNQLLGLSDYQVRSWTGWHHHMTMCILAHFFLVRQKLRLTAGVPSLSLPPVLS
jgi:SRSO17 transposase